MAKTIFSVGFDIPGGEVEFIDFRSNHSLLDADIIVFHLAYFDRYYSFERYQGYKLFSEDESALLTEQIEHWRTELQAALDSGKTIIVFLSEKLDAFRYTGAKTYSGTGRSQKTTRMVETVSNYQVLPVKLNAVAKTGKAIRATGDLGPLAAYWKEYATRSPFEVYVEGTFSKALLTTKQGERIVGALIERGKGTMILIPPVQIDDDEFLTEDEETDSWMWTKAGMAFGKKLVKHLVEIDKSVRSSYRKSPAPPWVADAKYQIHAEGLIDKQLADLSDRIAQLQEKREILLTKREDVGKVRRLVYETGTQLENAIVDALRLMGFKADRYTDGKSEFDSVFESEEGRFLGEAEGKDNKAINIEKFSQLVRNVQEDFARDDVAEIAIGVLFGNAYRLTPVEDRNEAFTEKCMQSAKQYGVVLVRTPDLFPVAKYLTETADATFAKRCREAIFKSTGDIASFPKIPTKRANK